MVNTHRGESWMRQGFSLLWGAETLSKLAKPNEVASLREFFTMAESWPAELPSCNGNALVVAGLEGCLDVLDTDDAVRWIEHDLKEVIFSFQEEYEGQASLVLWIPSGRNRITMRGASEEYHWKRGNKETIHIGQLLWSGAEKEVERILDPSDEGTDYDGKAYVGLHHRRIS